MQKSKGYASGLTWVKYNQKLAFHLRDMILGTIFSATLVDSMIHHRTYYGMQCDAEMMQQLINKATTTLKTEYILWANKLALITNVLIYVSTSSRNVSFSNKCFSYTNPSCFVIPFYRFNLYSKWGIIIYLATNYSGATKITVSS